VHDLGVLGDTGEPQLQRHRVGRARVKFKASAGVDNAPLHALQDGVSGGDGVYAYGSTSSFPNNTWQSSNYWVDVVFTTG
jgi:Domain of unknown function (DUF4082)